jgi:glycosyltransferase involved in cell wall biosynthesis
VKILFVSPAYAPAWKFGGVVVSWHRLLEEMVFQGNDVTVHTTDAGLPHDDEGARTGFRLMNGVKVHYFKCDCKNPILSRALTRETREKIGEFDLMHLAAVWQPLSIGVRRAAVEAGCPYVISLHGALDPWSRNHKRLKKQIYHFFVERKNISMAAAIRVTSQMESNWSSSFAGRGQELRIVPNGIDLGLFLRNADAADKWRAEAGIPANCFLYLSVGRLHYKKGLELAVEALAPLRGRKWHLAFVGNDEDGTGVKLAKLANDLGLADHISFHPTVSTNRLPAIYSAGDLFVLPSLHENFGNVVLEALACECPVLISDQVAISGELLGVRGVAVRKRELSLWSKALASALDGGDEFKISKGDRGELEKRFSIKNSARKMIELHQSVIARVARNTT